MTKLPKINQVFFFLPNHIYLPVIKDDKIYFIYLASQVYNPETFKFLISSVFWFPIILIFSGIISIYLRIDSWIIFIIFTALSVTPIFRTYLDIADEYFYNKFKIKLKMVDREVEGIAAIEAGNDQKFYELNKNNKIVKIEQFENILVSNKLSKRIWPERHFGMVKFEFKSGVKSDLNNGKTIIIDPDPTKFSQILNENKVINSLNQNNYAKHI